MTPGPPFPPPPTIGWPPGACPTLWRSSTRRRCTSPKAAVCRPRPKIELPPPPLNFLLLLSRETASHCSISSRTPLQLHPPHLPVPHHHLQDSHDHPRSLNSLQTNKLYTCIHLFIRILYTRDRTTSREPQGTSFSFPTPSLFFSCYCLLCLYFSSSSSLSLYLLPYTLCIVVMSCCWCCCCRRRRRKPS